MVVKALNWRAYAVDLGLPAAALTMLAFLAPQAHGMGQVLVPVALLAVSAQAAVGLNRSLRAAERRAEADAAMTEARDAIESASRATHAVLAGLEHEVLPSLETILATAERLAADRRLSASVRGRANEIRAAGAVARAMLGAVVGRTEADEVPPMRKAEPSPPAPQERYIAPEAEAAFEPDEEVVMASVAGLDTAPAFQSARPLRVLAAEHNGVHQLFLRTVLSQAGIEPEIVGDAAQLIEAWKSEPWDLILLDVQMPETDALALTRMIRSAEIKTRWPYTPIVALAANPSSAEAAGYADAGMDSWVGKPIAPQKLLAAIEAALEAPAPGDVALAQVA